MINQRNFVIDSWKGLAILAVIAIHSLGVSSLYELDSLLRYLVIWFRQVLNFAVPLFFFFSGYFSPSARNLETMRLGTYYKKKLLPLWLPYLFWTVVSLALREPASLLHPDKLVVSLLLGTGIGVGYFVVVLSCLFLIHPFVVKRSEDRKLLLWGVLPTFISLAASYYVRWFFPDDLLSKFPYYAISLSIWIFFFQLGVKMRQSPPEWGSRVGYGCVGIALTISFVEASILLFMNGTVEFSLSAIKITSYAYSTLLSVKVLNIRQADQSGSAWLCWLGRRSYVIYLSHMLFLGIACHFIVYFRLNEASTAGGVLLVFITTLVSVSAFVHAIEMCFPERLRYLVLGVKG